MMVSSDERREVARKIRKYVDAYGDGIDDAEIGIGGAEMVLLGTVRGRDNRGDVVRPTSEAELLSMLADLIDPTCEVESVGSTGGLLSYRLSCGHTAYRPAYVQGPPPVCPCCGARVVDDE